MTGRPASTRLTRKDTWPDGKARLVIDTDDAAEIEARVAERTKQAAAVADFSLPPSKLESFTEPSDGKNYWIAGATVKWQEDRNGDLVPVQAVFRCRENVDR